MTRVKTRARVVVAAPSPSTMLPVSEFLPAGQIAALKRVLVNDGLASSTSERQLLVATPPTSDSPGGPETMTIFAASDSDQANPQFGFSVPTVNVSVGTDGSIVASFQPPMTDLQPGQTVNFDSPTVAISADGSKVVRGAPSKSTMSYLVSSGPVSQAGAASPSTTPVFACFAGMTVTVDFYFTFVASNADHVLCSQSGLTIDTAEVRQGLAIDCSHPITQVRDHTPFGWYVNNACTAFPCDLVPGQIFYYRGHQYGSEQSLDGNIPVDQITDVIQSNIDCLGT